MNLEEYKKKRDFKKTQEPDGTFRDIKKKGLVYVIQRHDASHLHYDLRLEEESVLKSWAIPKDPPLKLGIKRLAVQTEDHPLGYEDFEGTIPEGEYGAGDVKIWDKGTYLPLEKNSSKRIFDIAGKKLQGKYCLIKLKSKNADDKNWLFFKMK
ncbi:MAG: DNA polymerase ligase N-terminal domain-containing protein [Candidatus Aminicenantaceae bacterium]